MKAIAYYKFGAPEEVMQLAEVPKPIPKENEVLVKVKAAGINPWDWDMVRGQPKAYRFLFGFFKPRHPVVGSDVAGVVEAVGQKVTAFKPGDEVFGDISPTGFGSFAEYVTTHEKYLANKPEELSFEEAAAIPQAGVLALQGLRYNGEIRKGQKVLFNGSGGGVGSFAIQLVKLWSGKITAVDHGSKLRTMKGWGADQVMDYCRQDFTKTGQTYDLIVDVVAEHKLSAYRNLLNPGGSLSVVGGLPSVLIKILFGGSLVRGKKMGILAHVPNRKDLEELGELCASGKIKPIIDCVLPLKKTSEGVAKLGAGKVQGNVVIKVSE